MTKIKSSALVLFYTVSLACCLLLAQVQRPGEYPRGEKPSPMMNFFVTSEPISATRSSCTMLTDEEKASLVLPTDDLPILASNRKSELLSDKAYDYFRSVDLKVFS